MSDQDEKQTTEDSGSPLVSDLTGLGRLADSKLIQSLYKDLGKAGAKQSGKFVTDIIKAFRLFTAPVQLLALVQDLLEERLERVRSRVPEERQIEAPPQVAGPILENLRYMIDGDILTEMYLNLLARAIDRDRVGEAHPAFVKIIEQLSPDEALIMLQIKRGNQSAIEFHGKEAPEWLMYPGNFGMYISHLESLNLITIQGAPAINLNSPDLSDAYLYRSEFTKFGQMFVKACVPEDFNIADWKKVVASLAEPSPEESS